MTLSTVVDTRGPPVPDRRDGGVGAPDRASTRLTCVLDWSPVQHVSRQVFRDPERSLGTPRGSGGTQRRRLTDGNTTTGTRLPVVTRPHLPSPSRGVFYRRGRKKPSSFRCASGVLSFSFPPELPLQGERSETRSVYKVLRHATDQVRRLGSLTSVQVRTVCRNLYVLSASSGEPRLLNSLKKALKSFEVSDLLF